MFTAGTIPPSWAPRPEATLDMVVACCRAGLRAQGGLAQQQLAGAGRYIRANSRQWQAALGHQAGTAALTASVRLMSDTAQSLVGVSRLMSEANARTAANLLRLWEHGCRAMLTRTPVLAEPAPTAAEPVQPLPTRITANVIAPASTPSRRRVKTKAAKPMTMAIPAKVEPTPQRRKPKAAPPARTGRGTPVSRRSGSRASKA